MRFRSFKVWLSTRSRLPWNWGFPCFSRSLTKTKNKHDYLFTKSSLIFDFHAWTILKIRGVTSSVWCFYFFVVSRFISWRFSNKSSEFKKTLFAELEMVFAISLAASIFLSVIKAGLLAMAWPISLALVASPWYTLGTNVKSQNSALIWKVNLDKAHIHTLNPQEVKILTRPSTHNLFGKNFGF